MTMKFGIRKLETSLYRSRTVRNLFRYPEQEQERAQIKHREWQIAILSSALSTVL